MTFYPSIQALIGPNTPQNSENTQCSVGWAGNVFIVGPHPTISGAIYIAKQQFLTGIELASVDISTWTQPPFRENPIMADTILGDLWLGAFQPSNFIVAGKQSDLTFQTDYSCPIGNVQGEFIIKLASGVEWVAIAGIGAFVCQKLSDGSVWSAGVINFPASTRIGIVTNGPGSGNLVYAAACDFVGTPGGDSVYFYKFDLGAQTSTLIGTFASSAVDPAWTGMTCGGMALDLTDNKIVAWMVGGGGGTFPSYLVKFNPATLAIDWATGTSLSSDFPGIMMSQSAIAHSKYYYLGGRPGGGKSFTFDTSTGVLTTYTAGLDGIVSFGGQASNDVLGCVIDVVGFNVGVSSPILLNSTPASFQGWSVLYVAPPPAPILATGTHASYVRIWGNMPR